MDKQEARVLFQEADRLYRSENYIEALQHLSELENEFSDDFNVLYPMLLCREKLGRLKEAREQCNRMMDRYNNAKHRTKLCQVYARLLDQETSPQTNKKQMPGNEFIKDEPYIVEIDGSGMIEFHGRWIPWKSYLLSFLGGLGIFTFILVLPFLLPKDEEGVAVGANIIVMIIGLFLQYSLNCIGLYIALWTTNKLLHDDILLDVIDVCLFTPIFALLSFIPLFGWIIAYYTLANRYDMGIWDFLTFLVVFTILNIAFVTLILPALFGAAIFNFL